MAAGAKKPMPQYENTSKAKVKADKMAADIAGYFGYVLSILIVHIFYFY